MGSVAVFYRSKECLHPIVDYDEISKNKLLFEAGFSIRGGKEGCQYLVHGEKAFQINLYSWLVFARDMRWLN